MIIRSKEQSFFTRKALEAKMTNYNHLPAVPYYDASQKPSTYYEASQQASAEQGEYSPMPAAYHPCPSTAQGNCGGETVYAPLPPSYTEQEEDPTSTQPTEPAAAEKLEAEQESKEKPKASVADAIAGIISLAILAAILYGINVGFCKAHGHFNKATPPSPTTTTQQYQQSSQLRLVTLYGPSTTVVSWVGFGPDGTGLESLEGREEK
jgi:hypothetical protein